MNVRRCADCGNSPKNRVAEQVAIALFDGDRTAAISRLSKDAVFEVVGATRMVGRDEILQRLIEADDMEVNTVITHGRAGAVSGSITRAGSLARFSLIVRFATAKANAVSLIELYSPDPDLFCSAS